MLTKKTLFVIAVLLCTEVAFAAAPIVDYSESENATSQTQGGYAFSPTLESTKPASRSDSAQSFAQPLPPPLPKSETANNSDYDINTSSMSLGQRIARLERQIHNLNQNTGQKHIEELQQQLQSVNGKLEEQSHDIKALQQQLQDYYKDLNSRVEQKTTAEPAKVATTATTTSTSATIDQAKTKSIKTKKAQKQGENNAPEKGVTQAATADTAPNADVNDVQREQQTYQSAFDALQNKKYKDGIIKLHTYLKTYPNGTYAANAHYWLGELYFLQKNNAQASAEFSIVINKYPTSNKVPEALLKASMIHEGEGKHAQAQSELKTLKSKYPNSTAAKLAAQ